LQAVIGDDPFDAALADGVALLADFLSDDFGGRIRIQETTADDQPDNLVGAAVIGFGSRVLQQQTLGALLIKGGEDLVIALAGEIVFVSGFGRAEPLALAFDKHGEATTDLVILGDQEGAARSSEAELFSGESNMHRRRVLGASAICQIEYGGIVRREAGRGDHLKFALALYYGIVPGGASVATKGISPHSI